MNNKRNQPVENFILWLGGLVLLIGGVLYAVFPQIERRFRSPEPEVTNEAAALPNDPVVVTSEAKVTPTAQLDREPSDQGKRDSVRDSSNRPLTEISTVDPAQVDQLPATANADIASALENAIGLVDSGQWQKAEQILMQIIEQDPQSESALVELTMINLLDKKDPDAALPFLKRALTINSDNESLITELLAIHDEKGTPLEAVEFLKSIAQEGGENHAIEYGLAQALLRASRPQDALEYLEKSVESREGWDKDEALEQLGDTHADLGHTEQALESWRLSMERQKAHMEAVPEDKAYLMEQYTGLRLKIASGLMELGKLEELEALLSELEKEIPDDDWVASLRKNLKERTF